MQKKLVASRFKAEGKFQMNMCGVSKAEGETKKAAYGTCFSEGDDEVMNIVLYFGIQQI